jgi:hypothetical protein
MVDLPVIFALIVAFSIALYVLLDGFDLGVGMLFLHAPSDEERDVMMNSIAPGLGWKRDLARDGRNASVRRLSNCLCRRVAGPLCTADDHAVRARVPRCRL